MNAADGSHGVTSGIEIRSYRPDDRADVYDICRRTGAAGLDATGLYSDDELLPAIFAGPYLEFDPTLVFVADTGARVAGYIIATGDTRAFAEWYARNWLPNLARFALVVPPVTAEDEIVNQGYHPGRMLIPEVDEYPAHLHIDLLPELQGRGVGRHLMKTLRAELAGRGIRGVHLTMDPANTAARAFYDHIGFRELPSSTPSAPVLGSSTSRGTSD